MENITRGGNRNYSKGKRYQKVSCHQVCKRFFERFGYFIDDRIGWDGSANYFSKSVYSSKNFNSGAQSSDPSSLKILFVS